MNEDKQGFSGENEEVTAEIPAKIAAQSPKRSLAYKITKPVAIALCIILIPIIIVNLVLIVKSFVYPDRVPDFFGYKAFVVNSGSMDAKSSTAPRIKTGDLVVCRVIDPDKLKVNDTIAYKLSDEVVLHQIIEKQTSGEQVSYTAKGTNNNTPDPRTVAESQVEGIYLLRISKIGSFALFLQTPMGISLFVVIPIILFILYDVLVRAKQQKLLKSREDELTAELERLKALQNENNSE